MSIGARDERGVVAVWVAICIVVFFAFAGWAVDFSHWNNEKANMQKAADAAALAGAVYLPDNPSAAIAAAKDLARQNGYSSGVSATVLSSQNQIKVAINTSVKNSFSQVIGFGTANLHRHAVGEYESPQPLDFVLIIDRTGSMNTPSPATFQSVKDATYAVLKYLSPKNESIAIGVLGPSNLATPCGGVNAGAYGLPSSSDVGAPGNTWMVAPYPLAKPANDYQNTDGSLNQSSQVVRTINCLATANRTDLGDPIAAATSYLDTYGRPGAKKGIIMMTDGAANLPGGTQPCSYANDKAAGAKAAGIQVLTIGFLSGSNQCNYDTSGTFRNAEVTKLLASMASPIKGVAAHDDGCTDFENSDGDNFFCQPKGGDISKVFLAAVAQLAGRLPRIVQ